MRGSPSESPGSSGLGLASSGLHTNGYSLARKALFDVGGHTLSEKLQDGRSIGEALAEPHRSYLNSLWPAVQHKDIQGLVHITGSGFQGNIPRVLPKNLDVIIDRTAWEVPEIFNLIQQTGDVEKDEMYSTFNMGIGMLVFIEEAKAEALKAEFEAAGEQVCYAGKVIAGEGKVLFQD